MLNEFRSTSITWDKATRRIYSPITANESDSNGRKLNIQVVNSGQVENLTGATLHLYWETKDRAQHGLDAFTASDISKGEFEIFYTTGMLSNVGELNATLVLVDATGQVVSDWFKITVARGIDDDAIQSENSFTALTQALIDVSNLEQNYAPRLNDLTTQLQQTEEKILTADKNIVFMADSYGTYNKDGEYYSWTENAIATLGLTDHAINLSQGSRGFAFNPAVGTFKTGLQTAVSSGVITHPEKIKRIIICGGTNDLVGIALRHITDDDLKTAIQDFMTYAKAAFPNANISVGFNGNCNVGSYETPYYKALNAYKTVAKHGGSFMKNLEYALRRPNLLDDSGLHPSAAGFSLLYEKTIDCILNGSCNVNVNLTSVDFTQDISRGTWNISPSLHFSQSDNIVGIISSRGGIMYSFTTPVTFDDLVGDGNFGGFKLIRLGKLNNTPLRGGHIDGNNGNKYKVLGYIRHRVLTNNGNPLIGAVPLVMCGYDLYVGIADSGANAEWLYQSPSSKTFTGLDVGLTITGIYFDSFKIDVDIGSLDYIN